MYAAQPAAVHFALPQPRPSGLFPLGFLLRGVAVAGKRRYGIKLWRKFQDVFNVFPLAAVVDEKIFCVHAGISPELNTPQQINNVMRPTDVPDSGEIAAK